MAAVDGVALPYPARSSSGHRNAIEEMVQEGHIDNEIVAALTQQELMTSKRNLLHRS